MAWLRKGADRIEKAKRQEKARKLVCRESLGKRTFSLGGEISKGLVLGGRTTMAAGEEVPLLWTLWSGVARGGRERH